MAGCLCDGHALLFAKSWHSSIFFSSGNKGNLLQSMKLILRQATLLLADTVASEDENTLAIWADASRQADSTSFRPSSYVSNKK